MLRLTRKQREILDTVIVMIDELRRYPMIKEIADRMNYQPNNISMYIKDACKRNDVPNLRQLIKKDIVEQEK